MLSNVYIDVEKSDERNSQRAILLNASRKQQKLVLVENIAIKYHILMSYLAKNKIKR